MENQQRLPVHVSIIMDGNGRWAQQRGQERVYGHAEGVESVRACTEAAAEDGIKYLSLYAFSEENWNRPESEVESLMEIMAKAMVKELSMMLGNNIRFMVLGNRARLSEKLNAQIDSCMAQTAANTGLTLILFLSYSGKWDILQAARKLALELAEHPEKKDEIEKLDEQSFSDYLVTAGVPDPDLIIRTSGELRMSNYLLWQGAYSELYFTDVLWPDFRKDNFRLALAEYAKRDRRYGKVK